MAIIDRFPGLKKAALDLAYDNGMINRDYPEAVFLENLDEILSAEGVYEKDLLVWSNWLDSLSEEDRMTVVAGEEKDMLALLEKAPKGDDLHGLLNDFFES